jgi:hypothetical protein
MTTGIALMEIMISAIIDDLIPLTETFSEGIDQYSGCLGCIREGLTVF